MLLTASCLACGLAHAGAVEALREFLATTQTLSADFSQTVTGQAGRRPQVSAGSLSLSRPGKLRWEVVKPYPQLLVGDGEKVWIYDPELQQVSVRKAGQAIGGTPAALLAGSAEFERQFVLAEAGDSEGFSWVEATPKGSESSFRKLRVGFSGKALVAMDLSDHFGQETKIRFSRVVRNGPLAPSLFRFVPPAGADVLGD